MAKDERAAQALADELPPAVLEALGRGDEEAFLAAVAALDPAEARRVHGILARLQEQATTEQLVEALPDDFRDAMARDDHVEAQRLFDGMPAREQDRVNQIMHLLRQSHSEQDAPPSMTDVLANFEPLLQAAADVALGDHGARAEVEQVLDEIESRGWQIAAPIRRIWAGERDTDALTAGLDDQDALLVMSLLGKLD
jgi:hypothetical protein